MVEEKTETPEKSFVEQLKENDIYTEFIDDTFDAKEYANTVIESHIIGDALAKLSTGIELLNKELQTQVADHHEDLLSQATGIETLEGVLQSIHTRCQSLVKSVQRVRSQIVEPYNRISSRTKQLRRLQTSCDYLRRIIRVISVSKRLQIQLNGGSREITKAAQSLNELEFVLDGVDLSGIQIVEKDLAQIKKARVEVNKQAKEMLKNGLNSQNQTVIGTALQVFHNLGSLYNEITNVMEMFTRTMEKYIHESLDITKLMTKTGINAGGISGPGRAAMPLAGSSWHNGLWDNLELLMNNMFSLCQKVFLMEKVLVKKKDPSTHVSYIETFCEDNCSVLFKDFWNSICSALRSSFDKETQDSTHLKQAFEGEYPKLLRLFNDFWSQVIGLVDPKQINIQHQQQQQVQSPRDVKVGFHGNETSALTSLKSCMQPFETAYLSRSLSRLFDSINLVFPTESTAVPSKDEVGAIVKTISSELNVASVDEHLMILVAKNVSKTVQLYSTKCEQLIVTTSEAGQLGGGLTNAQIRNVSVVNSLGYLRTGITEILLELDYPPQEAIVTLDKAIISINDFMDVSLSLLLSSIMRTLETKMLKMSNENFAISAQSFHETQEVQSCSNYVTDIQNFISSIQSDYLSLYTCTDFLLERLKVLTSRVLQLFVRYACLTRQLSEGGKLKMAADMTQLEFAVTPLCKRFEDLGHEYKQYRAFRPLLFQTLNDIPSNPNLGESLTFSTVLHFLFSQAPSQFISPHTFSGWTVTQYSDWLDEHNEESERINLLRKTIDSYAAKMEADGQTDLSPVYTIMKKLLQQYDQKNIS
ncbi:conserved oligomeric Golgi complex subunit 5-like [Clytia hemisphaerica]|uniref:conserved oligomeric Golgi complex subunit 5-like n=1 Tax=Clytia hemisphaerica TaxID=252671 RepID=UPI0034D6377A